MRISFRISVQRTQLLAGFFSSWWTVRGSSAAFSWAKATVSLSVQMLNIPNFADLNALSRVTHCDWISGRSEIRFSVTKEAFDCVDKHLELHPRFVKLITSSHTRGQEVIKSRQIVSLSKGL